MHYRRNKMKTIYTLIVLLGLTIVSTSQIFLWKDQVQQWQILETQIKMLNRLLDQTSDAPFVYEDELPHIPKSEGENI